MNFIPEADIIGAVANEIKHMSYQLVPLQAKHAKEILVWRYPPPYDFYDAPEQRPPEDYVTEFLRPEYQFHAILDDQDHFIGFCSFGIDGQVPGGNYESEALDIGLGMRPELTGKGNGYQFVDAILLHARKQFDPSCFRMTVASFNERALKLYKRFGFNYVEEFVGNARDISYTILTCPVVPAR